MTQPPACVDAMDYCLRFMLHIWERWTDGNLAMRRALECEIADPLHSYKACSLGCLVAWAVVLVRTATRGDDKRPCGCKWRVLTRGRSLFG
jgi:hypothetical protein